MINNIIHYKERKVILNRRIMIQKELSQETIDNIIACHKMAIDYDIMMCEATDVDVIDSLVKMWTMVQFDLQSLWGYDKDSKYHRFWTLSACTCPKMDNNDRYPDGHYIYNLGCKLHGEI